jgi:hypothetical protein
MRGITPEPIEFTWCYSTEYRFYGMGKILYSNIYRLRKSLFSFLNFFLMIDQELMTKRKSHPSIVNETNESLLEDNGGIRRNIIYADPPWEYTVKHHDKGTTMSGLANQHYSTMSLNELKQLKVQEIAAKDCILFLWTTGAQMENSIELMSAWGFEYKTMFMTWIKTTKGEIKGNRLGFYCILDNPVSMS